MSVPGHHRPPVWIGVADVGEEACGLASVYEMAGCGAYLPARIPGCAVRPGV